MNFLVVTYAPTIKRENQFSSYAPYVKEMDIWFKHAENVGIVSPFYYKEAILEKNFKRTDIKRFWLPFFYSNTFGQKIKTVILFPVIIFQLIKAFIWADHIHLRCPGNVGLIACFVQLLFPWKTKTAKYAGNWDPKSPQPLSYRIQRKILSNTSLTKKMNVLVYGDWKNQTNNIKSFFTATYRDSDKEPIISRKLTETLEFSFIGSLVIGKRPLVAIQIVETLFKKGYNVRLDLYGDGIMRSELQEYIQKKQLKEYIQLHGNVQGELIKEVHKTRHFMLLPSKSEGWPKVVAEAMFWGSLPIVTKISCVPYMLDEGNRGVLIDPNVKNAVEEIEKMLQSEEKYQIAVEKAIEWSRTYTLDKFEQEIKSLL
ncbi:glycosyltransferase [uncultured Kordia sp.]|uniref:glycosyltransferase n=1 Tax=uncultured Kordia sp. TaxID=507699 RepID=UPI00260F9038|nr:glycosyltransferase [uncultured Kordia sp.]